MTMLRPVQSDSVSRTLEALSREGFRLFFPMAAIHAAVWPLLWVIVSFNLPFASSIPPGLWHAHEMIIGTFGAALIGFITTSVPEWTDTKRLRSNVLLLLAALWGCARLAGLFGVMALDVVSAVCDILWIGALVAYLVAISLEKRTTRLSAFIFWIGALLIAEVITRYAFLDVAMQADLAQRAARVEGLIFLGILGVALARVSAPVTNLVLDPSEETSPFRPHPGRINLAPGLVGVLVAAQALGLSDATAGYLFVAAGAAFMDRVAEAFIGRSILRAEILALAGSSALAGSGLILIGISLLDGPVPEHAGLHLAFMGGLGLGILSVFAIAGLRHTGRALGLVRETRLAMLLLVAATLLRVVPEIWPMGILSSPPYFAVSLAWASAFLLWLKVYWPFFRELPQPSETSTEVRTT